MFFDTSTARTTDDAIFCARLKRTRLREGVLFLRGELDVLSRPTLGVVGSRECSSAGLTFARSLSEEAASLGLTVVSGGARGIDAAAHTGALGRGGTIVVLATPLTKPSPSATLQLCARVLEARGLLVSEYADGERVHRAHFLERNRIIAALSDALLVIDARERSGALTTARHARRLGRPVWVTPGAPWDAHNEGSNTLLAAGARPITSLAALRDALEERFGLRAEQAPDDPLLATLRTPKTLDAWRMDHRLDIVRACRLMFDLVAAGKVVRMSDGRYIRRR